MKLKINEDTMRSLIDAWPDTDGDTGVNGLEMCIHEMAHVLGATGGTDCNGRTVSEIIGDLHFMAQDYNEIRASAVTRWALIALGMLTPNIERVIFTSMESNIETLSNEAMRRWWGRMYNSRRTFKMGVRLAETMFDLGVVQ